MSDPTPSAAPRTESRLDRIVGRVTIGITLFLWVGLSICYAVQPDACAATTVYPSWCWFACGMGLALILFRTRRRRMALTSIGLWFLFLVVFADTPLSLWRGLWNQNDPGWREQAGDQFPLRVISLNAHGSSRAVAALQQYEADLILVQETPSVIQLRDINGQILGENAGLLAGVDSSIMSRTPLEPVASTVGFMIAKVKLKAGREIGVVSLRLTPPPFRSDLWNPECWRAYRDQRILQREELRVLSQRLAELPPDLPLIVGGDFNVNPRDPIFRELPARLRDAFASAGAGWGCTIINEAPFLRIDQVRCDHRFQPLRVVARRAENTDHRAVIADLLLD